jgi:hypothetical protein
LLRRQEGLQGSQVKALSIIQQSGEHLLGLIDEILDMAKIEHGTLDIVDDPFDCTGCSRPSRRFMRVRAEAKGLAFTTTESAQLPAAVMALERRLRQVADQSARQRDQVHALGHGRSAGSRRTRAASALWSKTPHRHRARPLVEISICFISARSSVAVDGTGLGLAISRRLTRLMGGELRVASIFCGVGSRFWFDLDLPEVDTPAPIEESDPGLRARRSASRAGRWMTKRTVAACCVSCWLRWASKCTKLRTVRRRCAMRFGLQPDAILMDIRNAALERGRCDARDPRRAGAAGRFDHRNFSRRFRTGSPALLRSRRR